MKIHYYIQFFPGEQSVGTRQPLALARRLADRGHAVTVISSDFNLYSDQPERAFEQATRDGGALKVFRLYSPRGARGGLAARFACYVVFAGAAVWKGLRLERPDLILGSIQPLFTGWAASRVARRSGVPFVLQVRDLWPDALEVKEAVTGRKARILHRMADSLYHDAQRIVSITPGIKKELIKKGLDPDCIDVFPNGFDPELFRAAEAPETVRQRYGWDGKWVAIYTGSFTQVTATDTIVRAAEALRHRADIRFDFFGSGPAKSHVTNLAREMGLENVHFHDPVPKNQVPGLLAAADVALMCLFRSPLVHIYFENKLLDYMGAGKPILAAMEGEQAEIIRRYDTGRTVPAFDHEGLARLVAEAADHRPAYAQMGENGRRLVYERFLLPVILDRYADMLEAVATGQVNAVEAWEP